MISAGVSKLGKTPIYFVKPHVKINAKYYCEQILSKMLPAMSRLSGGDYVLQQDGARAHTARETLKYLDEHCPEYVKPDHWAPNSCNQNPLDCAVWGELQAKVWGKYQIDSLDYLKSAIVQGWRVYPQETIDKAINQFIKRIKNTVAAVGGYIEHYM